MVTQDFEIRPPILVGDTADVYLQRDPGHPPKRGGQPRRDHGVLPPCVGHPLRNEGGPRAAVQGAAGVGNGGVGPGGGRQDRWSRGSPARQGPIRLPRPVRDRHMRNTLLLFRMGERGPRVRRGRGRYPGCSERRKTRAPQRGGLRRLLFSHCRMRLVHDDTGLQAVGDNPLGQHAPLSAASAGGHGQSRPRRSTGTCPRRSPESRSSTPSGTRRRRP